LYNRFCVPKAFSYRASAFFVASARNAVSRFACEKATVPLRSISKHKVIFVGMGIASRKLTFYPVKLSLRWKK
jgi:hypothetical protein